MLTDKIPSWLRGFIEEYDGTIRFPKGTSPLSSPPSNPNEGWVYLDDGTNTESGNPAWRGYISSSWQDIGGTMTGPASSTDNAPVRWDGTGGDTLQDTPGITLDDSGNVHLNDDIKAYLGSDNDYSLTFDSANDQFEIYDEGASSVILTIESDGTIDVQGNSVNNVSSGIFERVNIDNNASAIRRASKNVTSKTEDGRYSGTEFTDGLQTTLDNLYSDLGKNMKKCILDGHWNESFTVDYSGGLQLEISGESWASLIDAGPNYIHDEDVTLRSLWFRGADLTVDSDEEFHCFECEFEDSLLEIKAVNNIKIGYIYLQNPPDPAMTIGSTAHPADKGIVSNIGAENGIHLVNTGYFVLNNVTIDTPGGKGLWLKTDSGNTAITNVTIKTTTGSGIVIDGNTSQLSNFRIYNSGNHALEINGDYNQVSGGLINDSTNEDLVVAGNNNVITGINVLGETKLASGSTENILYGRFVGNIQTAGTRNVVNGYSFNDGDPSSTGMWNGHATKASQWGVVVEDYSGSPSNFYRADSDGNWVQIG